MKVNRRTKGNVQFLVLLQLLSSATEWSPARQAVCPMLLRRMVALLPPPHQALFTQAHPPSSPSHLPLWAHLHLAALSEPLQAQVHVYSDATRSGRHFTHTHNTYLQVVQQLAATSVEVITTQLQSQQPDFPSLVNTPTFSLSFSLSRVCHIDYPSSGAALGIEVSPLLTLTPSLLHRNYGNAAVGLGSPARPYQQSELPTVNPFIHSDPIPVSFNLHIHQWGAVVLCDSVEVMSALLPLLSPQPLLKVCRQNRTIS